MLLFFPSADTKYSVAKNVGRECQESSVPFPDLATDFGRLPQHFHAENAFTTKYLKLHRSNVCPSQLQQLQLFLLVLRNAVLSQIDVLCAFQTARYNVRSCAEHPVKWVIWEFVKGLNIQLLRSGSCGWFSGKGENPSISLAKLAPRNEVVADACWCEELLSYKDNQQLCITHRLLWSCF